MRTLRLARLGAAPPTAAAAPAEDAVMADDGAPAAVLVALVDMSVVRERAVQVLARCRVKSRKHI